MLVCFSCVCLSLAQAVKTPLDARFCVKNAIAVKQIQLEYGSAHRILVPIEYRISADGSHAKDARETHGRQV